MDSKVDSNENQLRNRNGKSMQNESEKIIEKKLPKNGKDKVAKKSNYSQAFASLIIFASIFYLIWNPLVFVKLSDYYQNSDLTNGTGDNDNTQYLARVDETIDGIRYNILD